MSLSWKDVVATFIVAGVAVIAYAILNDFNWTFLSSYRWGSLLVLFLGFATCIVVGSGVEPSKSSWTITASVLGVIAILAATIGIILDSRYAFIILVIDILVLWFLATIHHMVSTVAAGTHA
jgi:hypothetical protein